MANLISISPLSSSWGFEMVFTDVGICKTAILNSVWVLSKQPTCLETNHFGFFPWILRHSLSSKSGKNHLKDTQTYPRCVSKGKLKIPSPSLPAHPPPQGTRACGTLCPASMEATAHCGRCDFNSTSHVCVVTTGSHNFTGKASTEETCPSLEDTVHMGSTDTFSFTGDGGRLGRGGEKLLEIQICFSLTSTPCLLLSDPFIS